MPLWKRLITRENLKKPKNNFLKFLAKIASAMIFKQRPFSSNRDKMPVVKFRFSLGAYASLGFSSPIPYEARRKEKGGSFETPEPSSPKVSCIGQIKYKNKMKKANRAVAPLEDLKSTTLPQREAQRRPSAIQRLFTCVKFGWKTDRRDQKPPLPCKAPSLNQMKLFKSGRDGVANFSWTAQITPLNSGQREYCSDEEMEKSDREEKGYRVPFSAPMPAGNRGVQLQPRKEVNLWRRRSMNRPMPLKLNR